MSKDKQNIQPSLISEKLKCDQMRMLALYETDAKEFPNTLKFLKEMQRKINIILMDANKK